MNTNGKKAIIIGSGIAGLSLAACLQKYGYQTEVFEQHSRPGGVTATLSSNGFKWDLGPMMLEGIAPAEPAGKALKEVFPDFDLKLVRGDRSLFFKDFSIQPGDDFNRNWRKKRLSSIFPEERKSIRKFLGMMDTVNDLVTLEKNIPFKNGFIKLLFKAGMSVKYLAVRKYSRMNSCEIVDLFFKNDKLKAYFMMILADMTVLPDEYPALALAFSNQENAYNRKIRQRKVFCFGPGHITYRYVEGGNGVLINNIIERLVKNGGRVHTSAPVRKIHIQDNCACGVETSDGVFHESDIVAVSGPAENCFFNMIGREYLDKSWIDKVENLPLMESVFMIHLGIDFNPAEYQPMPLAYYYNTYDVEAGVKRTRQGVPQQGDDGFLIYIPSFHSPDMAPEGKYAVTVYTIAPYRIDGGWESHRARLEEKLLNHAERIIPGLQQSILEKVVITPEDYGKMVHQVSHHSFGGARPDIITAGIPHKTPFRNLWFIGSQSECGPGVWTQILAAKKISEMIATGVDVSQ